MSLSARTPTTAITAGFVRENWSNQVIDVAEKNLVCWDAIDHSWQSDLVKGNIVNIGITNHVDASEIVVGTKAASTNIASGALKQLTIDKWYEIPIDVDYMTIEQGHTDWGAAARREAAYSIKVVVDTSVATLFSTLNSASLGILGADGSKVDDDLLRYLTEVLNEQDVPMDSDRSLIIDPSVMRDLLEYDKFVSSMYVNIGAVENGIVGKSHPIYGCNIRMTNNLVGATTGAYAAMLHKDAITSALQIDTPWTKEYEDLHQRRYQHEALWGVLEVRDLYGVCFYTRKS